MRILIIAISFFSSILLAESPVLLKPGIRIFDTRVYKSGSIVNILANGSVEVKLEGSTSNKIYTNYYASDLATPYQTCKEKKDRSKEFCLGDTFSYSLNLVGKSHKGKIMEIFRDENNRIIYSVKYEDENKNAFLNSTHFPWMKFEEENKNPSEDSINNLNRNPKDKTSEIGNSKIEASNANSTNGK